VSFAGITLRPKLRLTAADNKSKVAIALDAAVLATMAARA
jgi:hypothetical protein